MNKLFLIMIFILPHLAFASPALERLEGWSYRTPAAEIHTYRWIDGECFEHDKFGQLEVHREDFLCPGVNAFKVQNGHCYEFNAGGKKLAQTTRSLCK